MVVFLWPPAKNMTVGQVSETWSGATVGDVSLTSCGSTTFVNDLDPGRLDERGEGLLGGIVLSLGAGELRL